MMSDRIRQESCCHHHNPRNGSKLVDLAYPPGQLNPPVYASGTTSFLPISEA
jgi:hypothetical protein